MQDAAPNGAWANSKYPRYNEAARSGAVRRAAFPDQCAGAAGVLADGVRSGGALVDERGNVVGFVSAKLNTRAALSASGALPENVNYAVKSSFLLGFLESVPEASAKLKEPETKERKFEDVVKSAEQAAGLVLAY